MTFKIVGHANGYTQMVHTHALEFEDGVIHDPTKWDMRFLRLAEHFSAWSKDPSTKNGTVIVGPDRDILSYGYNGLPRGVNDSYDRLADRAYKIDHTVHSELNAILNAGRNGVRLQGSTLYQYGLQTCHSCGVAIVQAGVKRVVQFYPLEKDRPEWEESARKTATMFDEVGIEHTTYREWVDV